MLRNVIGKPVRGMDFYNRESELRKIWQDLTAGNNLLLVAPRRVGKSSLLYRLERDAALHGMIGVYVSVAEAQNEIQFIERLLQALGRKRESASLSAQFKKGFFKQIFEKVGSFGVGDFSIDFRDINAGDSAKLAQEFTAALKSLPGRWLIMVDELPIFLTTMQRGDGTAARIRAFMNWFRDLRQGDPDRDPATWILAGSIGLDKLTRHLRIVDTINDLKVSPLGEFSPEVADRFLKDLGASNDLALPEDVRRHICARVGWCIPHSLHILFSSLRDRCQDGQRNPTVPEVDAAFEDAIGPAFRIYFDHWSARLTEELGPPQDDWARSLLTAVARDNAGLPRAKLDQVLAPHIADPKAREEMLTWLLDVLEGDGYLVKAGESYRFRSPLLREYWKRRFDP